MNRKYIEEAFARFRADGLKTFENHPAMIAALRNVFFGGAIAMYHQVVFGMSEGADTTREDLNMMNAILHEIKVFEEEMKATAKRRKAGVN